MRAWVFPAVALAAGIIAAAALPAHGQDGMRLYAGDGFSFEYPGSWAIYDDSTYDWDGWLVHVWAFGPEGNTYDSRIYVAHIPPVMAEGEARDDALYLERIAASEEDFCLSGEISWGYFECAGYELVSASHDESGSRYTVVGQWVRAYEDGSEVSTVLGRVDVPGDSGTLVMYAEAPAEKWERLGLAGSIASFAVSDAG